MSSVSGTVQFYDIYPAVRLWALIMHWVLLFSAMETLSNPVRVSVRVRGANWPALQMKAIGSLLSLFLFSHVRGVISVVCFAWWTPCVCIFISFLWLVCSEFVVTECSTMFTHYETIRLHIEKWTLTNYFRCCISTTDLDKWLNCT